MIRRARSGCAGPVVLFACRAALDGSMVCSGPLRAMTGAESGASGTHLSTRVANPKVIDVAGDDKRRVVLVQKRDCCVPRVPQGLRGQCGRAREDGGSSEMCMLDGCHVLSEGCWA